MPVYKITEKDALLVRHSTLPATQLAEIFGISVRQVHHIKAGKRWRYLKKEKR